MKDRGSLEAGEEVDIDHHDMEDMNTSTLVISESALSINGEDSRDSCNQLSIDTGETDQDLVQTSAIAKPSIRIAKGLTRDNNENNAPLGMGGILAATLQSGTKRKQINGGPLVGPMLNNGGLTSPTQEPVVKKQRPNSTDNDQEIVSLEKEVRALQWLARRKEKEWDQVISLLKQREEKLIKAQRTRVLIQAEAEHLLSKHKPISMPASSHQPLTSPAAMVLPGTATMAPVIVPQQQVLILPSSVTMTSSPLNSVNTNTGRLIQPKPTMTVKPATNAPVMTNLATKTVTSSSGVGVTLRSKSPGAAQKQTNGVLTNEPNSEQKIAVSIVTAERAAKNLQKAASGVSLTSSKEEVKKSTPDCQGCGKKKSEFVCAGCSNRWYCSRECQVSTIVKLSSSGPGPGRGRVKVR